MWGNRESRMEILTWIATIGTVLGAVFVALPLVPKAAFSLSATASILIGASVALAGLLLYVFVRRMRQSDIVLVEAAKDLNIIDPAGKEAVMIRRHTYAATRNVTQWVFALSMKADGLIEDIRLNGEPVKASEIEVILGSTHIRRVMEPLKKGQQVIPELSYRLRDSYTEPKQTSVMGVSLQPRKIVMRIRLPQARPCKRASGYLFYNDQPSEPLDGVVVSDSGRQIDYSCRNPTRGAQYHVQWEW